MSCTFPLCKTPTPEGIDFCLMHAKHFGPPKEEKKPKCIPIKSVKRIVQEKLYKKIVKEMLEEDDRCAIKSPVCTGKAEGLDHKQKRSPSNYLDRKNLVRSCNACNIYKENYPEWAVKNGHSKSRFTPIDESSN